MVKARVDDVEELALDVPGAALASLRMVDPAADCFLIVPALGTPARSYRKLAEAIAAHGHNAISFDLRGMGSSQLRASRNHDWGYDDLVGQELSQVFELARDRLHAQARIFWVGHSLGGHLALLHQRHCRQQAASGVALIASGSPWRGHYPWRIRLGLAALRRIIAISSASIGYFPGDRIGFGGRQPARLMRQWSRFAAADELPTWGRASEHADAARSGDLHLLAMRGDNWSPKHAMVALANHFCRIPPPLEVLNALPDGSTPDHFSWLRQPEPAAAWLAEIAGRTAAGQRPTGP